MEAHLTSGNRGRPPGQRGLAALFAFACFGLLVAEDRVRVSGGLDAGRGHLIAIIMSWLTCSTLLALLLARLNPRHGLAVVLVLGALVQLLAVRAGPQLSDDLYRYTWDAKVAAAGVDPYLYPPTATQLIPERDTYLWPGAAECAGSRAELPRGARSYPFSARHPSGCTRINRPNVRTVYPPTAQLWFRLARLVTPDSARELQIEAPAAVSAFTLTALLALLLRDLRRPPAWALLYGASPLAGLETVMDGHVDAVGVALVVAALLVLQRARGEVISLWAAAAVGVLLALAALVKLYPALVAAPLLPALSWRGRAALAGAGLGTVVVLYAPHVVATSGDVLGYLPGYLSENGYDSGGRYVLLAPLKLGQYTSLLVGVAVLSILVLVAVMPLQSRAAEAPHASAVRQVIQRATLLTGAVFIITTPGAAWYSTLLVALATAAGRPEWLGIVVANYYLYTDALLGWHSQLPVVTYAVAAALVATTALVRRRTSGARAEGTPPPELLSMRSVS